MSNEYKDWLREEELEQKLKEKIMEKSVGNTVLVEVIKKNNSGIIVPDSVELEVSYVIRGLGTGLDDTLGLAVGQEIIVRGGSKGQTLDSGLVVLAASSVVAIVNYEEK